jgi:N-acetylglucosamine kinase-like BadF-type ATPase
MKDAHQADHLIIGVDGGGTKTDAVLAAATADGRFEILGRGRSGASNMRLAGRSEALSSLGEAIGEAARGVLGEGRSADIAVLGLAGSEFPDIQDEIRAWAKRSGLCRRIEILNDAEPVLAAGTPERWGVALVVGTGSIAIGQLPSGKRIIKGGWGHWYGDHGSGYDLGARALGAVSEAEDGMGPETELSVRLLEHFKLQNPRMIIQKLYASGNVRARIAATAPVVLAAAEAGDIVAHRIAERCAGELVRLVTAVTCDLEIEQTYPLALAGGVICRHNAYRARLESSLRAVNPSPGPITPVPEPVMGCLKIGLDYLTN